MDEFPTDGYMLDEEGMEVVPEGTEIVPVDQGLFDMLAATDEEQEPERLQRPTR